MAGDSSIYIAYRLVPGPIPRHKIRILSPTRPAEDPLWTVIHLAGKILVSDVGFSNLEGITEPHFIRFGLPRRKSRAFLSLGIELNRKGLPGRGAYIRTVDLVVEVLSVCEWGIWLKV